MWPVVQLPVPYIAPVRADTIQTPGLQIKADWHDKQLIQVRMYPMWSFPCMICNLQKSCIIIQTIKLICLLGEGKWDLFWSLTTNIITTKIYIYILQNKKDIISNLYLQHSLQNSPFLLHRAPCIHILQFEMWQDNLSYPIIMLSCQGAENIP